jgi:peptidoglycan/LPS O-acetylase OafA/YrhL
MRALRSAVVQNKPLLPGIHGLRGIAATAVVFFHLIHIGGVNPPSLFAFIGRDFGYSVHLFFIVSAFTLMYSTEPRLAEPDWLRQFFIRRFFRIAPLFYAMLTLFLAAGLVGSKGLTKLILNTTFTFGFVPSTGVVWGGWAVGVEMIFYVIFPVLLLLIRTPRSAFLLLVISMVIGGTLRAVLHDQYLHADPSARYDWSYFSFAPNVFLFVMGIFAYLVTRSLAAQERVLAVYARAVAVAVIGGLLFSNAGARLHGSSRPDILLWGVGLCALCVWQSNRPSAAVANAFFGYLGERSYSIYLVHPVMIYFAKDQVLRLFDALDPVLGRYAYFICAGAVMLGVAAVAEVTYRVIEVPGIALGRRMLMQGKRS